MRINPVLRNEGKISVRTWKFPLMVLIYTGILAAGGLLLFKLLTSDALVMGLNLKTPIRIYQAIAIVQTILLLFIVPSLSSAAISSEREKQTLEVLLSSKMSSLSIVIGKLFSSVSKVIMLIFLSLPVYGLSFLIGGVNIMSLVELSLFLIVAAFFVASIGIFYSTYFKSTKASTAATYGTVLFIVLGILIISIVLYYSRLSSAEVPSDVEYPIFVILSPFSGFLSHLVRQLGVENLMDGPFIFLKPMMQLPNFDYYVYISMAIQSACTVVLTLLSGYKLNPLKGIR